MLGPRILSTLVLVVTLLVGVAVADDFRIETKVFSGKEKEPVSQNITLFHAGFVYDYLSGPERVAVFDRARGRFILLDPARKVKVELKTDDVLVFSEKAHAWAAKSSNPFLKFAAEPNFEVALGKEGELTLNSPHMTYRLETLPAESPGVCEQYREFSDWYARFNSMLHVGATPPFPRLAVNKELAARNLVPTEVALTIPAQNSLSKPVALRSVHHVSWRLLQRDLSRISETANQLATFKIVSLAEFEPDAISKK
jgi:hypothetical protein